MANQLKMAEIEAIRTLHKSGRSQREIARLLGIHRDTVAKHLSAEDSKPAKPDHRVRSGPQSECEPFRDWITARLEDGLSGQRIYQDLCAEHGFQGSYSSVRRFVRRLGKSRELPFRRIETKWKSG